jgi:hypothetical protein
LSGCGETVAAKERSQGHGTEAGGAAAKELSTRQKRRTIPSSHAET